MQWQNFSYQFQNIFLTLFYFLERAIYILISSQGNLEDFKKVEEFIIKNVFHIQHKYNPT